MRASLRLCRSSRCSGNRRHGEAERAPRTLTGLEAPLLLEVVRAARAHTREVIDTLVPCHAQRQACPSCQGSEFHFRHIDDLLFAEPSLNIVRLPSTDPRF
jgi:hypothetical protein